MSELVLTPSQTSGPLFGFWLLFDGCGDVEPSGSPGIRLDGRVVDGTGKGYGFPRGLVEVWHGQQWTRARTDEDGRFRVHLERPAGVTAPDGTFFAPHYNVAVFGVGLLKQVLTRLYFPDEIEANQRDAVLQRVPEAVRERLLGQIVEDGVLQFEMVLQGEHETPTFGW